MKTLLKWLGRLAAFLIAVILVAGGYIYIASERAMARTYSVELRPFAAPKDAQTVAEGERQAILHGCTSCHGATLQGQVIFDDPAIARIRTPNITRIVPSYTDSELARLVRHGVKRDSTGLWVMPASSHISDADLGAIIAYLRTVPTREGELGELKLRRLARLGVALGQMGPSFDSPAAHEQPTIPNFASELDHGRYIVKSACTECHGSKLEGSEMVHSPNLLISAAYQDEDFTKLMRTGVGITGRDLGKMTQMGKFRFSHFTDQEIHAVRTYLKEFVRRGGTEMP